MPTSVQRHAAWVPLLAAAVLALSGCGLIPGLGGSNNGSSSNNGGSNNNGSGSSSSTSASASASGDTVDIFSITVGDCLTDDTSSGSTVSETGVIDCSEPHSGEVYSSSQVPEGDGTFPGDDAVSTQAETDCVDSFTAFVGVDYQSSELNVTYLVPTSSSWDGGDREILCIVMDPSGTNTGSLQGANR